MSELDANIIVDGQKTIAAIKIEGEIIKSGGEIDATCSVQDSDGKKHLAIKVFPIESEETSKNELAAQVLTNDNELAVVMQEQEGSIISENENDFNCLVETENNEKQKAVKTIILDGTLIKSGGAIDTTCLVQDGDGNKQLALKVFNLGGPQPILTQYYAYSKGNNTVYTDSETIKMSANLYDSSSNFLGHPQVAQNEGLVRSEQVGTLTNNNGSFSGFGADDRIDLLDVYDFGSSWSITYDFTTGNTVATTDPEILYQFRRKGGSYQYGLGQNIYDGKFGFFGSRNGTSLLFDLKGTHNVQPNTHYKTRASFNGSVYKLEYSTDNGATYTEDCSYSSSYTLRNDLVGRVGVYSTGIAAFSGSINLKESAIEISGNIQPFYADAELVYNDEIYVRDSAKDKMGALPKVYNAYTHNGTTVYTLDSTPTTNSDVYNSGLSVVGKPTAVASAGLANCAIAGTLINNDGVISNFTQTAFVDMAGIEPSTNTWSFEYFVKTPYLLTRRNLLYGAKDNFYREGFAVEFASDGHFGAGFAHTSSSWDIGWISGTTLAKLNTWYVVRLSFNGTSYKLELKELGGTWNEEGSLSSTQEIYQDPNYTAMLGGTAQNADCYMGLANMFGVKSTIDTATTSYYSFGSLTYDGNTYDRDLANDRV